MKDKITAKLFYETWCEIADRHQKELADLWDRSGDYTKLILSHEDGLIKKVASEFGLESYSYGRSGYYWMDAVIFSHNDKIPGPPKEETWLRNIKIAVEHENNFQSGLFKEVGHLLITNCSLRVLITYPRKEADWKELDNLHTIISGSDDAETVAQTSAFLIIFGWKAKNNRVLWEGYTFARNGWLALHNVSILESIGANGT